MDNSWSGNQWVVLNSDMTVTLTENSADATSWTVASSRDLIDVVADPGSDFNPQSTSWNTNTFAAYPTDSNTGELSAWGYDDSPLKTITRSDNYRHQYH